MFEHAHRAFDVRWITIDRPTTEYFPVRKSVASSAKMRALDVFRSWIFAERSPYSVTPIPNVGLKWPAVPPQSPSA